MQIDIHDVDHGGCIVITGPQGHTLMLDCGLSLSRPWFPSINYAGQAVDTLMLLNLDEDHVEDLPEIWRKTSIKAVVSNPTVSAAALRAMKPDGMRAGVQMAHDILSYYGTGLIGNWTHSPGGVWWHAFWNRYGVDFTETNNLSLAVFVSFGGFTVLFGGDMECAGWERLLRNPDFVTRLTEVRVYVASHHGRDNGRCDALFDYMKPDVVIFSDGPKRHATQETTNWYGRRAKGIIDIDKSWNTGDPVRRKVMTTRKDGTMTIDVNNSGGYTVYYSRSYPSLADIFSTPQKQPNALFGNPGR